MEFSFAVALYVLTSIINLRMEEPYGLKHCLLSIVGFSWFIKIVIDLNDTFAENLKLAWLMLLMNAVTMWWQHRSWLRMFCDVYVFTIFLPHLVIYWLNRLITHLTSGKIPVFIMDPMRIADAHPKY
ncbi:hypothetical protein GCM10007338_21350 [Corynebacterium pelargi]|uniref:Uncharacterized protein n=1 Tax=Corynebacterium pelargi TaxID=1471400 RepID=A0A410WBT4_9CORY|nr:hypothetical protein CPELA_10835 [Corynebacterium pelargi]GGG82216.1 hypothetical protein GCM10007338_21350 [Corynebacterium pelargi]